MEDFFKCDIQFNDDKLNEYVDVLRTCFKSHQENFASLCYGIYSIWDYCKNSYFKAKNDEYYNSYKLLAKFGFDKKSVSRYKSCYLKFIVLNPLPEIITQLEEFSPSKLFELLSLSQDTIFDLVEKQILRSEMTVKEIRECIKSLNNETNNSESIVENVSINEDEIPMAFNPKEKYE